MATSIPFIPPVTPAVTPGFDDPVHQANTVFRRILEAMSHPGRIVDCGARLVPPAPLKPATAAVLLTLADLDAPIWLEPSARTPEVETFLKFHTGAPLLDTPEGAAFAVITDPTRVPSLNELPQGTAIAPEMGCTLIVEADELGADDGLRLTGPGIVGTGRLFAQGVPHSVLIARWKMQTCFPQGIDILFTSGPMLAALPRTTQLEL